MLFWIKMSILVVLLKKAFTMLQRMWRGIFLRYWLILTSWWNIRIKIMFKFGLINIFKYFFFIKGKVALWPTILEKWLGHCLFYKKKKPLSLDAMLIRVMLSEALPDHPTLIWWGLGKVVVKARTPLLSIKQCHAPFSTAVVSMEIVVINCIRCTNYFYRIVEFYKIPFWLFLINFKLLYLILLDAT